MRMVPNPGIGDYGKAAWAALLFVKCQDVPRLMREGFFWSVDDVLPEEGYMIHQVPAGWAAKGFCHARHWILADGGKSDNDASRWVGRLEVVSPWVDVVSRFVLDRLAPRHVCSASAYNASNQLIYNFNCRVSGKNYNCIYDDKPLDGWWPWPKREDKDEGGGGGGASRVFCPPAPGVRWEDELFPELPLARAPAVQNGNVYGPYYKFVPYRSSNVTYEWAPAGAPRMADDSGCVIL